jgi:energy-converting hydrogenase Eha subunit F
MPARYAFESLVAASGYGSDVAQDSACWALPAAQRLSLTPAKKQNCTCMGDNVLQRCNFPGVRTVVTSLIDQPEPVQPTPDEGVNQLPVQPLLRPGETLQQFSDEVNQYTLKLETYQGIVGSYLSSLQQYLEAATNWQRLQSYAIGNAESRIADQIDRYGPIYNIDLGAHWLILLATSLVLFVLLTVIQIGKGRA